MTAESLAAYGASLFVFWCLGYALGVKIRAFRDFTNSI